MACHSPLRLAKVIKYPAGFENHVAIVSSQPDT